MVVEQGAVERFLTNYGRVVESSDRLGETDTQHFIVNPLLLALGWEFVPDQIQAEFPIRVGRGTKHVDYCLKVDGNPVAFVEAKPYGQELDSEDLKQVLSYGRVEFIRWCFVTNGDTFVVLDSDAGGRDARGSVAFEFQIRDLGDYPHYLEALSPEGLASNRMDELVEDILSRERLLDTFAGRRTDLSSTIVSTIDEFIDGAEARALAEDLLNRVRASIESDPAPGPTEGVARPTTRAAEPKSWGFERCKRADLPGTGDELVAVFPSTPEGLEFIRDYQAWGFVRLARTPDYCAIYVSKPTQELLVVGQVEDIENAGDWASGRDGFDPDEHADHYTPAKSVLTFHPGTIAELEDPIPWTEGDPHLQGLRYTTLDTLKRAGRIKDLSLPG